MTDTLPVRHSIGSFPDTRIHRVFKWLAGGQPRDLTGCTARVRIGLNGQFLRELTGAATTGGTDGTVTLHIPPNVLDVGTYWYIVDVLEAGEPTRLAHGSLRVSEVYQ